MDIGGSVDLDLDLSECAPAFQVLVGRTRIGVGELAVEWGSVFSPLTSSTKSTPCAPAAAGPCGVGLRLRSPRYVTVADMSACAPPIAPLAELEA